MRVKQRDCEEMVNQNKGDIKAMWGRGGGVLRVNRVLRNKNLVIVQLVSEISGYRATRFR